MTSKPSTMKSICVFCGSSKGKDEYFSTIANDLGRRLAESNIKLIYGGAKIGLMGRVAKSCQQNGGKVIGVIPEFLDKIEITNTEADELYQTTSMHERKMKMSELSEGFIALPGGFGTLEELAEILTWSQLGLIKAPIGILNINGYYDHLIQLFEHMKVNELLKPENMNLVLIDSSVDGLLTKMENFTPPETSFMEKLDLT
jgi:uncharacterized protein (TIGR00730 family)